MPAVFPLFVIIVSGIVYHLVQKAAGGVSPWPMLAIAYGGAFATTLIIALASGDSARWQVGRGEWFAGLALGLAALGIEAGFFFIYRAGWPLGSASVIANLSVTAVLALVGVIAFGEHVTMARAAGLVLAGGGVTLIARG